jgi:type IV fimbrial biogenesis protein FimT
MKNKMKNSGFTLAELMITIVIAAILVSLAIPSFTTMIRNNRTTTQINTLLTDLNLARSEASKRGARVSVCSSTNLTSCAGNTNWATGWIVFIDQDNNGSFSDDGDAAPCETDAGNRPTEDCILRTREALSGNPTLTGTTNFVQYLQTGAIATTATLTLTPTICTGNAIRTLAISAVGRPQVTETACP